MNDLKIIGVSNDNFNLLIIISDWHAYFTADFNETADSVASSFVIALNMSYERAGFSAKTKTQISFAFVFATLIVQFLSYFNPTFQTSSLLL